LKCRNTVSSATNIHFIKKQNNTAYTQNGRDVNKMAVTGNVKEKKKSNQKGIVKFFKELKSEAKRITWPSKQDVKKATLAVASFSFLFVIFVGLLDYGFNNLYKLIFK